MAYKSVFAPGLFKDRTYVVTGGGSGIGRCTAHELASLGANVVIVGRNAEKLEGVVNEITEDGGRAVAMTCDIREESQVIGVIDGTLERFGAIHGLVNNAGGQ